MMNPLDARFSQSNSLGTGLKELVKDELAPYRTSTKVSVEGPDLPLNARAAQALATVLHELTANAEKYGALSTAEGQVAVRWEIAGEIRSAQLTFVWRETGGPAAATSIWQGLGTRLITDVVHHELGGRVELGPPTAGVRCEIIVPLAQVAGAPTSEDGSAGWRRL
jgi:two-component sensor histidine kinase